MARPQPRRKRRSSKRSETFPPKAKAAAFSNGGSPQLASSQTYRTEQELSTSKRWQEPGRLVRRTEKLVRKDSRTSTMAREKNPNHGKSPPDLARQRTVKRNARQEGHRTLKARSAEKAKRRLTPMAGKRRNNQSATVRTRSNDNREV